VVTFYRHFYPVYKIAVSYCSVNVPEQVPVLVKLKVPLLFVVDSVPTAMFLNEADILPFETVTATVPPLVDT